jgi:hypothetical protein
MRHYPVVDSPVQAAISLMRDSASLSLTIAFEVAYRRYFLRDPHDPQSGGKRGGKGPGPAPQRSGLPSRTPREGPRPAECHRVRDEQGSCSASSPRSLLALPRLPGRSGMRNKVTAVAIQIKGHPRRSAIYPRDARGCPAMRFVGRAGAMDRRHLLANQLVAAAYVRSRR